MTDEKLTRDQIKVLVDIMNEPKEECSSEAIIQDLEEEIKDLKDEVVTLRKLKRVPIIENQQQITFGIYGSNNDWKIGYCNQKPIGEGVSYQSDYISKHRLDELMIDYQQLEERCKELEQKLETATHALEFYAQPDFAPDNDVAVAAMEKLK